METIEQSNTIFFSIKNYGTSPQIKKGEGIISLKSETAEILYRNMKIKESGKPV